MNSDQVNLTNKPNIDIMSQNIDNRPKLNLEKSAINIDPRMKKPTEVVPKTEMSPRPQPTNSSNQTVQAQQQVAQSSGTVWSNQLHSNAQTDRAKIAQSIAQMSAQDDDLIEKEWVDITEKVIDKTKDDPYNQDEDQHVLSKHYLKKRFNLDVK